MIKELRIDLFLFIPGRVVYFHFSKNSLLLNVIPIFSPFCHGIEPFIMSEAAELVQSRMTIKQVPEPDLVDLLQHCDLPTRCKLRRLSGYWKCLVSSSEVNRLVIVDSSCLLVSFFIPENKCSHDTPAPGCPSYWEFDRLQYGVANPDYMFGNCADLSEHKRQGLLGPHVETIIFRGGRPWTPAKLGYRFEPTYATIHEDQDYVAQFIQSIGSYCSHVRHIVLWQIGLAGNRVHVPRLADFSPTEYSRLPQPECLTVAASKLIFNEVAMLQESHNGIYHTAYQYHHCKLIEVPFWSDRKESDEELETRFLRCSPAQRAWVEKYAHLLPEKYHAWAESGITRLTSSFLCVTETLNLRSGDFSNVHPAILWALTKLILRQKLPHVEPPPEPFEDCVLYF